MTRTFMAAAARSSRSARPCRTFATSASTTTYVSGVAHGTPCVRDFADSEQQWPDGDGSSKLDRVTEYVRARGDLCSNADPDVAVKEVDRVGDPGSRSRFDRRQRRLLEECCARAPANLICMGAGESWMGDLPTPRSYHDWYWMMCAVLPISAACPWPLSLDQFRHPRAGGIPSYGPPHQAFPDCVVLYAVVREWLRAALRQPSVLKVWTPARACCR